MVLPWQPPEGIVENLKPTELCNSDDPLIMRKTREVINGAETPKEAALKIFHYVRDKVLFALDNFDVRASDTLRKGFGQYVTKTNLQVALLRAAGIPARYHQAVLSRDSLKGIISSIAYWRTPDRIWWHPWCECHLSGRWISCDTLFDKGLYEVCCERGIISKEQIPTIDWDGESDLNTMIAWILEDKGAATSLDGVFRKAQKEALSPKIVTNILLYFSNRYTNKLRKR